MDILIIEDETRAANRIERLLTEINPNFRIVGRAESIREATDFLNNCMPNLIISDIQLADGLSFEIFDRNVITCPIIFTTAYDQYAMQAFETNGIDYLLKPIEKTRLEKAITKLNHLNTKPFEVNNLSHLLKSFVQKNDQKSYKSRFMIKVGDKIKVIPIEEIKAFYSLEKGTFALTTNNRNYDLEYSLEQIMDFVDPKQYFRINRKFIVHIAAATEIFAHTNSRLKLVLPGYEGESIIVAREKVQAFKSWLNE